MASYMLTRAGVDEGRIARIEGAADRMPRNTTDPKAPENRRIEISCKALRDEADHAQRPRALLTLCPYPVIADPVPPPATETAPQATQPPASEAPEATAPATAPIRRAARTVLSSGCVRCNCCRIDRHGVRGGA